MEVEVDARHLVACVGCEPGEEEAAALEVTRTLVAELFALPKERTPLGPVAKLPSTGRSNLPRAKPPPPPKEATKWEQFAQSKGIVKRKKGRMVWDEEYGEYKPAYGYKRKDAEEAPIVELKASESLEDPRQKFDEARKQRKAKNEKQRLANEQKLRKAQKSTASLGKFDSMRANEPSRDLKPKGRKQYFAPNVTDRGADAKRALAMLQDVQTPRARAPKRGQAERFDTHDGEMPETFKRKKGRKVRA